MIRLKSAFLIQLIVVLSVACIRYVPVPPQNPPITTPVTTQPPVIEPTCTKKVDPNSSCDHVSGPYHDEMNKILSQVTGCNPNSDCPLDNWKKTLVDVMTLANNSGFCSSYDLNSGNNALGSEFGLRKPNDNFTVYFQPITTAKKIRWAAPLSVCVPALDSNNILEVKAFFKERVNTSLCPVKVEGDYYVEPRISSIGGNPLLYTVTPVYCGFPLRNDVFLNCGTKCCTLGVDGGNETAIVCEKELFGIPSWTSDTIGLVSPYGDPPNPYNVKLQEYRQGTIKACGSEGPCGQYNIQ